MSTPDSVVVLVHGAAATGKSQLLNWRIRGAARQEYSATLEDELTITERLAGVPVAVKFLDTGGHPDFGEALPEWVQKTNAQLLVINVEDLASVEYVKKNANILATTCTLLGAVVVGNLPSGDEKNRRLTSQQGEEFAASLPWARFVYVEANTRNGMVEPVFNTLMECLGKSVVLSGAETKPEAKAAAHADVREWAGELNLSKPAFEIVAKLSWEELRVIFASETSVVKQELLDYGVANAMDRNRLIVGWSRRNSTKLAMENLASLKTKLEAQERMFNQKLEALEAQLTDASWTNRVQKMLAAQLQSSAGAAGGGGGVQLSES